MTYQNIRDILTFLSINLLPHVLERRKLIVFGKQLHYENCNFYALH